MRIKTIVALALFCTLFYFTSEFCKKRTEGFTLLAISSQRTYHPEWQTAALSYEMQHELEGALNQPYTYLTKGGQCFVFVSQDQRYVVKFFKQEPFKLSLWAKHFPIPYLLDRYLTKKKCKREEKLKRDFASYAIAFNELKEETGLLFVHLNKTDDLKKKLTIIDRLNIAHELLLDDMDFIVQKRADLVYQRIQRLMAQGDLPGAKQTITGILECIVTRCKKGYYDRDPNIRTNCGFIQDTPIEFDVGKLIKDERIKEPAIYHKELLKIAQPFKEWLQAFYPTLFPHIEQELERL